MTDKTTELIARARESAAYEIDELGEDAYVGALLNDLADAYEAEHQRAEKLQANIDGGLASALDAVALEAERDALRAAIQEATEPVGR